MFYKVPTFESIEVSEEGILRKISTGRVLKPYEDKDGYWRFKIWEGSPVRGRNLPLHRALALAFIPNPENKPQVNHKDSNRKNNNISNLEWVTAKENSIHASNYGFLNKGVDNPNNVYKPEQIKEVCRLLEQGVNLPSIVKLTGVSKNCIFSVKSRECWLDISKKYSIPAVKNKMSTDTAHKICKLLQEGKSTTQVASLLKDLGVTRGIALHIKNRKTFKQVSKDYNW